jgi:hypothetical protein
MREYALTTHHLFTEGEDGWISGSYDMFAAERVEDSEYREVEGETRLVPVRNRFESLEEAEEARDELNFKEAGPAGVIVSRQVGSETEDSPEQRARDMLEQMGVADAQSMTSGNLVELANLISNCRKLIEKVGYGTGASGERWCSVGNVVIEDEDLANLLADVEAAVRDV